MNPCIGNVTCPFCGNQDATVHREKLGKKALYFRCYGGPAGDCGTAQIRGPGGQAWLESHIRPPLSETVEREAQAAAGEVKAAARQVEREHEKKKPKPDPVEVPAEKKSFFASLLEED